MTLRAASYLLQVLTTPFVFFGLAMMMTIIGVPVGLAVFVGVWIGWRWARQVRRVGADQTALVRFRNFTLVFLALMAIPLVIALGVGIDDVFRKPGNIASLVIAIVWVVLAGVVAMTANRSIHRAEALTA